MNRNTLLVCIVIAAIAYSLGASGVASKDRPLMRWVSRAVALWFVFRDEPPPVEPPRQNETRYVHIQPGSVDHRNAL